MFDNGLEDLMLPLESYIAGFRHALANGASLPASARMDIDGAGSIHIADGQVCDASAADASMAADCVMQTSHEIYDQLYLGTADPAIAFAKGDLKINGDMSVALAMQAVFAQARAA